MRSGSDQAKLSNNSSTPREALKHQTRHLKKKKKLAGFKRRIRSLQEDEGNEEPREGKRDGGQECLKTTPNAFRLKQAREPAAEAAARKAWPHSALSGRGRDNLVHTQSTHSQINKQILGRQ